MEENTLNTSEYMEQAEALSLMFERDSRRYSRFLSEDEEDVQ